MATGHLITHSDLTLLCYIYLCKLHYSVRKLVADLDLVENSLVACCLFLVGDAVVVDKLSYKDICILISCPLARVDIFVINVLDVSNCDILALCNDFNAVEVADTSALLALYEYSKLLDES